MMNEETIVRTAAELVRRCARSGRTGVVRLQAPEENERAVRLGLESSGWRIAEPGEQAELLLAFFPDRDRVDAEDAGLVSEAKIIVVAASLERIPPGWKEVEHSGCAVVEKLNEWLAKRFDGEDDGKLAWTAVLHGCWMRSFLARSIGEKTVKSRLRGVWVWSFVRENASDPEVLAGTLGDRVWRAAATVFGLGCIPYFPGTWGALAGSLGAVGLGAATGGNFLVFWALCAAGAAATTLLCLAAEPWATRHFGSTDPREFVLDEAAGVLTACLFLPADLFERSGAAQAALWFIAFAGFRFFDILKLGVHWLERRAWKGAIVWDDLLAGVYAGLVVLAASWQLR